MYRYEYKTPGGMSDLIMNSDGKYLTGLWFEKSMDTRKHTIDCEEKELEIFKETSEWLDLYFSGIEPDFTPEYRINNLTPFRTEVIEHIKKVGFGEVITYGDIADMIAKSRGIKKMSAQAVGGAVGWNPICIIIPCHRIVGANGNLTGYGGGIQNKIALLKHEGLDMARFYGICRADKTDGSIDQKIK